MAARFVNSDYAMEAAKKGDVINVPIPVAQTASDVVPSNTPPAPASNTPDVVQIPLDNWKHSDFHLTDKELVQIDRDEHFFPMQAEEAVKALANAVNIDIFDEYKGVFGFAGAVPGSELSYDEEEDISLYHGQPFTGVAYELYPSGAIEGEGEYRNGLSWGVGRGWRPNGQLSSEGHSFKDVQHGIA